MAWTAGQEMKLSYLAAVYLFHRAGTSWSQEVCSMPAMDAEVRGFQQPTRNLCTGGEMEVPMKKEVHGARPPLSLPAVHLQSHYVLLHLFLWQASASEPQELSESLPDEEEDEEEEGFDVL